MAGGTWKVASTKGWTVASLGASLASPLARGSASLLTGTSYARTTHSSTFTCTRAVMVG